MKTKPSRLTQRQWLNVIIVVISAMFLLMVLIGKIMNPTSRQIGKEVKFEFSLRHLDFGDIQISRVKQGWQADAGELSPEDTDVIAKRWQKLLNLAAEKEVSLPIKGKTVLLYLEGVKQPIICKISLVGEQTVISFVDSGHQFIRSAQAYNLYYPELN